MLKEYFGLDLGKLGFVFGLLIGATVSVTLIYWAIFGFDTWKEEAERASDLMMAAAVAPMTRTPAQTGGAGQYICPRDGAVGLPNFDATGVPHCPVCGTGHGVQPDRSSQSGFSSGGRLTSPCRPGRRARWRWTASGCIGNAKCPGPGRGAVSEAVERAAPAFD